MKAYGTETIGVLYSYQNVETFEKNDIVGFYQLWKSFVEAFEETSFDYQYLCNITPETKVSDLNVSAIIFPLAVDISQEEIKLLTDFVTGGGKLIVSPGTGAVSESLKLFLSQQGILLQDNIVTRSPLSIRHKVSSVAYEIPAGNFYSDFNLVPQIDTKVAARWKESNGIAIGGTRNLIYFGYSWGQDTDRDKDVETLLKTLDFFWSDISARLTKEISSDEYKKIVKEIYALKDEADSVIQASEQLDISVPKYLLKKHFEDGLKFFNDFNSNYLFGNYMLSRQYANLSKNEFAIAYSLGIPVRKAEVRAIWLDRGTIVSMKNADELRSLIRKLAKTGFNVIFFETINAGYPIYPSGLLAQNPLINGWDPLQVAIEAAHLNSIELHAWVWTFAAGNSRHNLLVDQPVNYPGPIIAAKGTNWALATKEGNLRIDKQPETWLSPANKEACSFLLDLFSEIVNNYDIDGIQLDYIRFPFQKRDSQTGFDEVTKVAFKEATGKFPETEGPLNKIWQEWKVKLVNDFVMNASLRLKKIKPKLKISCAVFAYDRSYRMQLIQQDWETWLLNKWIDVVFPFYYSYSKNEVKSKLERSKKLINDQAIIIPGFNLRVLNLGETAERISAARSAGALGVALFASEHLDSKKAELLRKGPFREQAVLIPYKNPLGCCQSLIEEFSTVIHKITESELLPILADSETQKEVHSLTEELRNDFKNYSSEKSDEIEQKLISLQLKVKDWLSLEKYLDRDQRITYISAYLDQLRSLLNYMKR